MNRNVLLMLMIASLSFSARNDEQTKFAYYISDHKKDVVQLVWKNDSGYIYGNPDALKTELMSKRRAVRFIMNCGMYTEDRTPVGLFIEKGKKHSSIKKCNNSRANFCLQPQGIFYITEKGSVGISTLSDFKESQVKYAIQAAPMVVVNGKLNASLSVGRTIVRNGAGIRKDGKVVFAISKWGVSFHELGKFFIDQGCLQAIYFDGNVSKALLEDGTIIPSKRRAFGNLGAMVAVTMRQ